MSQKTHINFWTSTCELVLGISSKVASVKRQALDVARFHRIPSYVSALAHVHRRRYHDYWITPLSQRVAHQVAYRQHILPFTWVSRPALDRATLEKHLWMRRSLRLSRSSRSSQRTQYSSMNTRRFFSRLGSGDFNGNRRDRKSSFLRSSLSSTRRSSIVHSSVLTRRSRFLFERVQNTLVYSTLVCSRVRMIHYELAMWENWKDLLRYPSSWIWTNRRKLRTWSFLNLQVDFAIISLFCSQRSFSFSLSLSPQRYVKPPVCKFAFLQPASRAEISSPRRLSKRTVLSFLKNDGSIEMRRGRQSEGENVHMR